MNKMLMSVDEEGRGAACEGGDEGGGGKTLENLDVVWMLMAL